MHSSIATQRAIGKRCSSPGEKRLAISSHASSIHQNSTLPGEKIAVKAKRGEAGSLGKRVPESVVWGSHDFALQLIDQRGRLIKVKEEPTKNKTTKSMARSPSMPCSLSPYIVERRTVLELAVLLDGKIPIPYFNGNDEKKQEDEKLDEQLRRQMKRLKAVYSPRTKQKMFFRRAESMPCSKTPPSAFEPPAAARSVAELAELLRGKIPELADAKCTKDMVGVLMMENNVKNKKRHSRNAASPTTTFVGTKIDDYVDYTEKRRPHPKNESMALDTSVRQLARHLKNRIPMMMPDGSINIKKATNAFDKPDLFVRSLSNRNDFSSRGSSGSGEAFAATEVSSESHSAYRTSLHKSKSVSELAFFFKDRLPIGTATQRPDHKGTSRVDNRTKTVVNAIDCRSYARGKSGLRAAEVANYLPKGSVRFVASELKGKLFFPPRHLGAPAVATEKTTPDESIDENLDAPGDVSASRDKSAASTRDHHSYALGKSGLRAAEVANHLPKGSVRYVASELKGKLIFPSRSTEALHVRDMATDDSMCGEKATVSDLGRANVRDRRSYAPGKSGLRAAEVTQQIRKGTVLSVAADLKGKLPFLIRSFDTLDVVVQATNDSIATTIATSGEVLASRAKIAAEQITKGSVQEISSQLKTKLRFRYKTTDGSIVCAQDSEVLGSNMNATRPGSSARATEAAKYVRKGAVRDVASKLKERLLFRVNTTASLSKEASHESLLSKDGQLRGPKGTLRAADAQAQVEKGSVHAVAAQLKNKLTFRLHSMRDGPNLLSQGGQQESNATVRARAADAKAQVEQGSVIAVAARLKNKLTFRLHSKCDGPNLMWQGSRQESNATLRTSNTLRAADAQAQVEKGSVHAVAAQLKNKLTFRHGSNLLSQGSHSKESNATLRASNARAADAAAQVDKGSARAVATQLSDKLVFRFQTKDVGSALDKANSSAKAANRHNALRTTTSQKSQDEAREPRPNTAVKSVASDLKVGSALDKVHSSAKAANRHNPLRTNASQKSQDEAREPRANTAIKSVASDLKSKLQFGSNMPRPIRPEESVTGDVGYVSKLITPSSTSKDAGAAAAHMDDRIGPTIDKGPPARNAAVVLENGGSFEKRTQFERPAAPTIDCALGENRLVKPQSKVGSSTDGELYLSEQVHHQEQREPSRGNVKEDPSSSHLHGIVYRKQQNGPIVRHPIEPDGVHAKIIRSDEIPSCTDVDVKPMSVSGGSGCTSHIDGEALGTEASKTKLCQNSTTTTTTTATTTAVPAMDVATQQKALMNWRKRMTSRSVIKNRKSSPTVVSFSSYGTAANAVAKRVPKQRRWVSLSLPLTQLPAESAQQQSKKNPALNDGSSAKSPTGGVASHPAMIDDGPASEPARADDELSNSSDEGDVAVEASSDGLVAPPPLSLAPIVAPDTGKPSLPLAPPISSLSCSPSPNPNSPPHRTAPLSTAISRRYNKRLADPMDNVMSVVLAGAAASFRRKKSFRRRIASSSSSSRRLTSADDPLDWAVTDALSSHHNGSFRLTAGVAAAPVKQAIVST